MSTTFLTISEGSVKNLNKHAILDLIRFTPGGISRVELARHLGLTRAAVTSIINDLQTSRLVREVENQQAGGRKPIVLEINPRQAYVAGVDMGAAHLRLLLADSAANIISEWDEPFDIHRGPQACLEQVDQVLRRALKAADLPASALDAVGVGVPGPVNHASGRTSGPPIMPGWDSFPLREVLHTRWSCPVVVNNDAELGVLGEWAYGVGRGEPNLVYIKVGTGIGAGLLINGQIYQGATGSAGEIGHITINENGPVCICGNRGCLEVFAGGRAIARQAVERIHAGQRTRLSEIQPAESITSRDVLAAARIGDLLSQQIIASAGAHIGTAVASLVNLFNPGMIIIGGGVGQIGDLLLEPIRQAVQQRSLKTVSSHIRISNAILGGRSSAMGAVVQALSICLHQFADGNGRR